jgi:hypothetical protein
MTGQSTQTSLHEPLRPAIPSSVVARRHPDRSTNWVIVVLVHMNPLRTPAVGVLQERLDRASGTFPLIASRLRDDWWVPSTGPAVIVVPQGTDPFAPAHLARFALDHEPPVRVFTPTSGEWLLMCAHHFAFDGLSMVALLRSLLAGEETVSPDYTTVSSPRRPPTDAVRRLCRPADPIAPSDPLPSSESFVARSAVLPSRGVTARLAAACAGAAVAHNAARGQSLTRMGLSIAVGGVNGEAATYRRLDLHPYDDIEAAAASSLADPRVPAELVNIPRAAFLLKPALHRLSDTLLVSNLGRLDMPGATSVGIYSVARGRSAVAFGATGLVDGPTTLTLRTRYLDQADAETLLDRVLEELEA